MRSIEEKKSEAAIKIEKPSEEIIEPAIKTKTLPLKIT